MDSVIRYHKLPHKCVADQRMDGDQNMTKIKTVFEFKKYTSQRSIQEDMEISIHWERTTQNKYCPALCSYWLSSVSVPL